MSSQLSKVDLGVTKVANSTIHLFVDGFQQVQTDSLFAGKRVVVFAPIGAFTPTCSESHLPRYEELYRSFKDCAIDEVYCVAVNDAFVVNAWADNLKIKHVKMLPDGNGTLCKSLGMLIDRSDVGFGPRAYRFAMVINDCTIEKVFVENEDFGFSETDADSILAYLNPTAKPIPRIAMLTKSNCAYCARAKEQLTKAKLSFVELPIPDHARPIALGAIAGQSSVPQIFIDGLLIGGSDELAKWIQARQS